MSTSSYDHGPLRPMTSTSSILEIKDYDRLISGTVLNDKFGSFSLVKDVGWILQHGSKKNTRNFKFATLGAAVLYRPEYTPSVVMGGAKLGVHYGGHFGETGIDYEVEDTAFYLFRKHYPSKYVAAVAFVLEESVTNAVLCYAAIPTDFLWPNLEQNDWTCHVVFDECSESAGTMKNCYKKPKADNDEWGVDCCFEEELGLFLWKVNKDLYLNIQNKFDPTLPSSVEGNLKRNQTTEAPSSSNKKTKKAPSSSNKKTKKATPTSSNKQTKKATPTSSSSSSHKKQEGYPTTATEKLIDEEKLKREKLKNAILKKQAEDMGIDVCNV